MTTASPQQTLTYQEAARMLGRSMSRITHMVSEGVLHPIKVQGQHRKLLDREEVENYKRGERKAHRMPQEFTQGEMFAHMPGEAKPLWTDLDKGIIALVGGIYAQIVAYGTNGFNAFLRDFTEAKKATERTPYQRLTLGLTAKLEPLLTRIDRNGGMVTPDDLQELRSVLQSVAEHQGELSPEDNAMVEQLTALVENASKQNKTFAVPANEIVQTSYRREPALARTGTEG